MTSSSIHFDVLKVDTRKKSVTLRVAGNEQSLVLCVGDVLDIVVSPLPKKGDKEGLELGLQPA